MLGGWHQRSQQWRPEEGNDIASSSRPIPRGRQSDYHPFNSSQSCYRRNGQFRDRGRDLGREYSRGDRSRSRDRYEHTTRRSPGAPVMANDEYCGRPSLRNGGHRGPMPYYHHSSQNRGNAQGGYVEDRHRRLFQQDASFSRSNQHIRAFAPHHRAAPRFNDNHSVNDLIQITYDNLDAMNCSATAALWNKLSRKLSGTRERSSCNENHEQLQRNLQVILERTKQKVRNFSLKELTQTITSMARIVDILRKQPKDSQYKSLFSGNVLFKQGMSLNAELFQLLAHTSLEKLRHFDARNLSNVAHAYARLRYVPVLDGTNLFDAIAVRAIEVKMTFNPQDSTNLVWAFATAGRPHSKLFEAMGKQAIDGLDQFNVQDLSNTVWAYAAARIQHREMYEEVAKRIVGLHNLHRFDSQALANIVWAYSTAGIRHSQLFEKVAAHIVGLGSLDRFKSQELSNIAWAYASARLHHPSLFERVTAHIVGLVNMHHFNSQDISHLAWAYATAGFRHKALFEKMANHVIGLDHLKFDPQHLSNTVWAYATAEMHYPRMFEKVANHIDALDNLDLFGPQVLSNTVWAFATAGFYHPQLFEKVANHIVRFDCLDQFNVQHYFNIIWAYATCQVLSPQLFDRIAEAVVRHKEDLPPQGIANLVWSYATMGVDTHLFLALVPAVIKQLGSFTDQGLANIAWAYAVADVDAPALFNDHFIKLCAEKKDNFEAGALAPLHQWHLWRTEEKSQSGLPMDLQDRCYQAFVSRRPTESKFQNEVLAELSHIGLKPNEEALMTNSGYRIDALVEVNGRRIIGVEVDGPFHFIGRSKSPLGSTILKRRQVRLVDGIELVPVCYWDWDKLGDDQLKKQDFLRFLLCLD
jgi:hypothetical protein